MHCTDRVTFAAYRCNEEDNFDCTPRALPDILKRRQSELPLFTGFVCSVIATFCRCLCTCLWSLCWSRCLRCATRYSLCSAVSCCRLFLRCSRWILSRLFSLLRRFVGKSSPARIFSHLLDPPLLNLLCFFFCLRYWWRSTGRKHCYIKLTEEKPRQLS